MKRTFLSLGLLLAAIQPVRAGVDPTVKIEAPALALSKIPFKVTFKALDSEGKLLENYSGKLPLFNVWTRNPATGLNDLEVREVVFAGGIMTLEKAVLKEEDQPIAVDAPSGRVTEKVRFVPGLLCLVPSVLAVVLALLFRQVLLALFLGVVSGAWIVHQGFLPGLLRTLDNYIVGELTSKDHMKILLFTLLLGGMVGVMAASGGLAGMVLRLSRWARGPRSTQGATAGMGCFIFFDDYANSLLVGNSMRPLSDRFRLSREKLAYIVDSTAAPVASLALISTWIGYEVGLIGKELAKAGSDHSPYWIFVESLPFRFYSLLTLFMVFLIAATRRDYGPMLAAETRASVEGKPLEDGAQPLADPALTALEPAPGTALRASNAVVPILLVILATLVGFFHTGVPGYHSSKVTERRQELEARRKELAGQGKDLSGSEKALLSEYEDHRKWLEGSDGKPAGSWRVFRLVSGLDDSSHLAGSRWDVLRGVISDASTYDVLLWASFLGCLAAGLLALAQGILSLRGALDAWVTGLRSMALAAVILALAWSLGQVSKDLHLGGFVVESLGSDLGGSLPALAFVAAAGMSFALGSSWTTMSVLFPIVIPLALAGGNPKEILLGAVGAVLAGSCFGDHCSPISDTTVLSSTASACDHVDHVKTQLPYALTAGVVAGVCGYLPAGLWGVDPWICLGIGAAAIVLVVMVLGRRVPDPSGPG